MLAVLLASCTQPEAKSEKESEQFERPSDEVVEEVIDFGLLDSVGLSITSNNGEYTITGEFEVDPNEDPETVYFLLFGNAAGRFIPVQSFTQAEALASTGTGNGAAHTAAGEPLVGHVSITFSELEMFSRSGLAGQGQTVPELSEHTTSREVLDALSVLQPIMALVQLPETNDQLEPGKLADVIETLLRAVQLLQSFDPGGFEELVLDLQNILDADYAAVEESTEMWFDIEEQLITEDTQFELVLRSESGLTRTVEIRQPAHEDDDFKILIEQIQQERLDIIERPRSQQTVTMKVEPQAEALARLATPDGRHELMVCSYEDAPFQAEGGIHGVTVCQPVPMMIIAPEPLPGGSALAPGELAFVLRKTDYGFPDIFQRNSVQNAQFEVTALAQPGKTFKFRVTEDDLSAFDEVEGGSSLSGRVTGTHIQDIELELRFALQVDTVNEAAERVAFALLVKDDAGEPVYEDTFEVDLLAADPDA